MNKFKPGDKVRRIRHSNSDQKGRKINVGDCATVQSYTSSGFLVLDDIYPNSSEDYFELVSVEELIETVNLGYEARDKLLDMKVSLEHFDIRNNKWVDYFLSQNKTVKLRLKKKTFDPFFVNNTKWEVQLFYDNLHIGCRKYDKNEFHEMLKSLIEKNRSNYKSFFATSLGILHSDELLHWEDAKLILQKLNEMEK